jgi:hypothetical protein
MAGELVMSVALPSLGGRAGFCNSIDSLVSGLLVDRA